MRRFIQKVVDAKIAQLRGRIWSEQDWKFGKGSVSRQDSDGNLKRQGRHWRWRGRKVNDLCEDTGLERERAEVRR